MLFERLTSSGLGLTIGSIGGSTVRNITFRSRTHSHDSASLFHSLAALTSLVFRNVYMPNTFKVEPPPPARPSRRDHTPCRASTSNFAAAAASSPTFCTNPKQRNRPNAPRSTSCENLGMYENVVMDSPSQYVSPFPLLVFVTLWQVRYMDRPCAAERLQGPLCRPPLQHLLAN